MKKNFIRLWKNLTSITAKKSTKKNGANVIQSESGENTNLSKEEKQEIALQKLQNFAEENPNKLQHSEIVTTEEYDIFTIVTNEGNSFIALGNNRISEIMSREDCVKSIEKRDYRLMVNLYAIIGKSVITQELKDNGIITD